MSVDSMPAVPGEAFGVFLSSSPPTISTVTGYCVLRLPPTRRGSRGFAFSRHVQNSAAISAVTSQPTSTDIYDDETSYIGETNYVSSAPDDLNQGNCSSKCTRSAPIPCRKQKPLTASKPKKKVTFADNLGFDLEAVKVIREDPGTPPPVESLFIASCNVDSSAAAGAPAVLRPAEPARQPDLRVDFPQPVSNYAAFKARLLACCVAVESVIVESTAAGAAACVSVTVKVKNLAFEKHVFVRATRNGWKSHRDFNAVFHSGPGCSDGPRVFPAECTYDTFLLRADLLGSLDSSSCLSPIEFAVCYRAGGGHESWDNNGGSNYRLVPAYSGSSLPDVAACGSTLLQRLQQAAEPAEQAGDRWTTYAAWRTSSGCGSSDDIPYW